MPSIPQNDLHEPRSVKHPASTAVLKGTSEPERIRKISHYTAAPAMYNGPGYKNRGNEDFRPSALSLRRTMDSSHMRAAEARKLGSFWIDDQSSRRNHIEHNQHGTVAEGTRDTDGVARGDEVFEVAAENGIEGREEGSRCDLLSCRRPCRLLASSASPIAPRSWGMPNYIAFTAGEEVSVEDDRTSSASGTTSAIGRRLITSSAASSAPLKLLVRRELYASIRDFVALAEVTMMAYRALSASLHHLSSIRRRVYRRVWAAGTRQASQVERRMCQDVRGDVGYLACASTAEKENQTISDSAELARTSAYSSLAFRAQTWAENRE
ncbi:hypothetical protein BKA93DRAFT_748202 [Sparassis latifolia]